MPIVELESIPKVIQLLRSGEMSRKYADLINIREHPDGRLVLLNYTEQCQFLRAWDEITVWCRGLVIDTSCWEVAALPFRKFFNVGETPECNIDSLPKESFTVYEKLDGSLGISYRQGQEIAMASRGSFTSSEAVQGTRILRQLPHVQDIPTELTCLFEVICKGSQCVSNYDFEGLVLLSAFDRSSARELEWDEVQEWADRLGCRTPRVYSFETLADVLESRASLPANLEGYVVRFASGLRVKVKGEAYLALFRLASSLTEDRLLQELADRTIEHFRRQLPEEFRDEIEQAITELQRQSRELESMAATLFEQAPRRCDRKTLALWAQAHAPVEVRASLFELFDGKEPNWYKYLRLARKR